MSDGAEIVPLFPVADEGDDALPARTMPRPPFCMHVGTRLDTEARRVYCRECGREIDAFDALLGIARDAERYVSARKEAERRARLAQASLSELLRRERNAKARLRRLEKR